MGAVYNLSILQDDSRFVTFCLQEQASLEPQRAR